MITITTTELRAYVAKRLSERTLSKDAHVLVKLHGDAQHRDGRVLTRSDYDVHYGLGVKRGTPLTAALLSLLSNRPILFWVAE
jgi:hypothetical protein